jgi:hypothetical protein
MDCAALNLKMAPTAAISNVNAITQQAQASPASVQLFMVLHASIIDMFWSMQMTLIWTHTLVLP